MSDGPRRGPTEGEGILVRAWVWAIALHNG